MVKKYTSLMLTGAAVCIAVCVFLIWIVASTGDASMEWIICLFLLLGFGFFGGAYLNEKMSKTLLPPM
ncbi:hypothetical protein JXL21_08190 [Candidatus Bathyarchaeota archaeon]|nr:hypothetical protein [Candidatus Bathyarchaeota archaeon]